MSSISVSKRLWSDFGFRFSDLFMLLFYQHKNRTNESPIKQFQTMISAPIETNTVITILAKLGSVVPVLVFIVVVLFGGIGGFGGTTAAG